MNDLLKAYNICNLELTLWAKQLVIETPEFINFLNNYNDFLIEFKEFIKNNQQNQKQIVIEETPEFIDFLNKYNNFLIKFKEFIKNHQTKNQIKKVNN